MNKPAVTITHLATFEEQERALERMTGMTREEAFRCNWSGCMKPGEVYLGRRQDYLFCQECSARPELKRFKHRILRSEVEWWKH